MRLVLLVKIFTLKTIKESMNYYYNLIENNRGGQLKFLNLELVFIFSGKGI